MTLPKTFSRLLTPAILLVFVCLTLLATRDVPGKDLAVSYIGCKAVSEGQAHALYDHVEGDRHFQIAKPLWQDIAARAGYHDELFPYVQTPLWAYSLQPLCTNMDWPSFAGLFHVLTALSFAAMGWISVRHIAGERSSMVLGLTLAVLWLSMPMHYSFFLLQTHPLIVLTAIAAMVLAEKNRPITAGLLLALAATIKITPVLLGIYWLMTKRWTAFSTLTLTCLALLGLTFAWAGWDVTLQYIHEIKYLAGIGLVAPNNHSLPGVIVGLEVEDLWDPHMVSILPAWLKMTSTALSVVTIALAGWLRRHRASFAPTLTIALLGMTIFAPIAWSHYYIILIVPLAWAISTKRYFIALLIALVWPLPHTQIQTLFYLSLVVGGVCFYAAAREAGLVAPWRRKLTARL